MRKSIVGTVDFKVITTFFGRKPCLVTLQRSQIGNYTQKNIAVIRNFYLKPNTIQPRKSFKGFQLIIHLQITDPFLAKNWCSNHEIKTQQPKDTKKLLRYTKCESKTCASRSARTNTVQAYSAKIHWPILRDVFFTKSGE